MNTIPLSARARVTSYGLLLLPLLGVGACSSAASIPEEEVTGSSEAASTVPGCDAPTDLIDQAPYAFHALVDVNGDKVDDYCRFVGPASDRFLSCQLGCPGIPTTAINKYGSAYGYNSIHNMDQGYGGSQHFQDVNNDGRADFCRTVGNPGSTFTSCDLAGPTGFDPSQYGASLPPNTSAPFTVHLDSFAPNPAASGQTLWAIVTVTNNWSIPQSGFASAVVTPGTDPNNYWGTYWADKSQWTAMTIPANASVKVHTSINAPVSTSASRLTAYFSVKGLDVTPWPDGTSKELVFPSVTVEQARPVFGLSVNGLFVGPNADEKTTAVAGGPVTATYNVEATASCPNVSFSLTEQWSRSDGSTPGSVILASGFATPSNPVGGAVTVKSQLAKGMFYLETRCIPGPGLPFVEGLSERSTILVNLQSALPPPPPPPPPPPTCPGGGAPQTYWFCLTSPDAANPPECGQAFSATGNGCTYEEAKAQAQGQAQGQTPWTISDGQCASCF